MRTAIYLTQECPAFFGKGPQLFMGEGLRVGSLKNTKCDITNYIISGFGGLDVACWPSVLKFAGSNPAETVGFFRAKKKFSACLHSGREVKPFVTCRRFKASKISLNVTWKSGIFRQKFIGHFSPK